MVKEQKLRASWWKHTFSKKRHWLEWLYGTNFPTLNKINRFTFC